jgi:hypothetical protein
VIPLKFSQQSHLFDRPILYFLAEKINSLPGNINSLPGKLFFFPRN